MSRSNTAPDPLHWWSPRKIILQIILLQLAYSITATILITFIVVVMGDSLSNRLYLPLRSVSVGRSIWMVTCISLTHHSIHSRIVPFLC